MTKALQLARSFKRAGLRVVLCETPPYAITSHRFSRCVDKFVTTPSPDDPDYSTRLVELVRQESIDFYVPVCSPVASLHDSFARRELDTYCEVIHPSPQLIGMLDDKFRLAKAAEKIGLGACESHLITDAQQVIDFDFANKTRPFILKSIKYDSVRRLDLTPLPRPTKLETEEFVSELPIAPERPWVLQEYIPGLEFCTHSTARGGQLRLHVCCESSPFQVNYDPVDEPEVEAWVREFIDHYCLDGQISFDFIRADDDQKLYVIECNPRTHSAITAFHDHPHVAEAYLGGERESDSLPVTVTQRPLASAKPTFWMVHELWRIVSNLHRPGIVSKRLAVIRQGKDAVFDWNDPAPFFMLHHFHIPMLLLRDVWQNRGWIRVDFNIGKLVQPGGD
ncbi:MAG: ATP-grasp enzyme [Planctomycetota bacterium]